MDSCPYCGHNVFYHYSRVSGHDDLKTAYCEQCHIGLGKYEDGLCEAGAGKGGRREMNIGPGSRYSERSTLVDSRGRLLNIPDYHGR